MTRLAGLRAAVATVLLGVLVGWVVVALAAGTFLDAMSLDARAPEAPAAHGYMMALLQGDKAAAARYLPDRSLIQTALDIQKGNTLSGYRGLDLTHLGSHTANGITVDLYVVKVVEPHQPDPVVLTFAITTMGGRVLRVA